MALDWDADDPPSKEEAALERFLGDLRDKIDETVARSADLRRQAEVWKRELARKEEWGLRQPPPIWKETCPACNLGRIDEVDELTGYRFNSPCQWCDGSALVIVQTERRGR